MNADIQAFADQHGFDAKAVEFAADHIIKTMTPGVLNNASEDELLELVQAGALSANETHKRMCIRALTRADDFNGIVFGVLKAREKGATQ